MFATKMWLSKVNFKRLSLLSRTVKVFCCIGQFEMKASWNFFLGFLVSQPPTHPPTQPLTHPCLTSREVYFEFSLKIFICFLLLLLSLSFLSQIWRKNSHIMLSQYDIITIITEISILTAMSWGIIKWQILAEEVHPLIISW